MNPAAWTHNFLENLYGYEWVQTTSPPAPPSGHPPTAPRPTSCPTPTIWPTEAEESGKAPTPVRFERGSAPGQRHAP